MRGPGEGAGKGTSLAGKPGPPWPVGALMNGSTKVIPSTGQPSLRLGHLLLGLIRELHF